MRVSEMTTTIGLVTIAGETQNNIEMLRRILTEEQQREVPYEEAFEVGDALLNFFEALAEVA